MMNYFKNNSISDLNFKLVFSVSKLCALITLFLSTSSIHPSELLPMTGDGSQVLPLKDLDRGVDEYIGCVDDELFGDDESLWGDDHSLGGETISTFISMSSGDAVLSNDAIHSRIERLSEEFHGEAWYQIGSDFQKKRDYCEAEKYYQKALDCGHPRAAFRLGRLLMGGKRRAGERASEAVMYFRVGAESGDSESQIFLGWMFYKGHGVKQNMEEAIRWYTLSAESGRVKACHKLGLIYKELNRHDDALNWFNRSSDAGYNWSKYELGLMYLKGEGVEKNLEESYRLFFAAAESGMAEAYFEVARMLEAGKGVEKNLSEAAKWYEKAARAGDNRSRCILAGMYLSGSGVSKDQSQAAKLFQAASESGSASGSYKLANLYMTGRGVEENHAEALSLYEKSCHQGGGDIRAFFKTAELYFLGDGCEKNVRTALDYIKNAAQMFSGLKPWDNRRKFFEKDVFVNLETRGTSYSKILVFVACGIHLDKVSNFIGKKMGESSWYRTTSGEMVGGASAISMIMREAERSDSQFLEICKTAWSEAK